MSNDPTNTSESNPFEINSGENDLFTSSDSEAGDLSNFDDASSFISDTDGNSSFDEFSGESSDSNPFGLVNTDLSTDDDLNPPVEEQTSKGKKKGKKAKASKAPKAKVEKPKRPRAENVPWIGADSLLVICMILSALLFLLGDLLSLIWYGMSAFPFIVLFSLFGLFLVFIPFMLWREHRFYGVIPTVFDSCIALSLALIVIGCMILISVQSMKYGTEIKAKVSMAEPATQMTCRWEC